jgi:hypothetical protein
MDLEKVSASRAAVRDLLEVVRELTRRNANRDEIVYRAGILVPVSILY